KQLSEQVKESNPILIGISFGGIDAQEMRALLNHCPVLILASVKTRTELPFWMKAGGKIGLQKFIPVKKLLENKKGNHWFFGTKTTEEKTILNQILADSDPIFTKWAIHQIVSWKRKTPVASKVLHIHGTKDRIFNIQKLHPDYTIEGGTHFMTVSKHEALSKIIREALDKLSLINQE
uniref:alpha/beta fold hydrolase n=1 Tax=Fluviicola sp. TaxID=1917219 RepID=UPI0026040E86